MALSLKKKKKTEGEEKEKSSPSKPPGGFNEITPQKIELARPTEGRNARN